MQRMRPKLHLPVLGALSASLVSWHSSSFGRLCCATSIYSRVARFKPVIFVDTSEVAQVALQVTLIAPDSGRVTYLT
jgi:hypothetical protein